MRRPNRCDVANAVLNVALFALGCIVLYAIAKALPAECLAVVLLLNGLRDRGGDRPAYLSVKRCV
jgi:hypothetical protein